MITVYKYPLKLEDSQVVELPYAANVLCVQAQYDLPYIWALVDTETRGPINYRTFRIHGTGHEIKDANSLVYIDTFQLHDGALVFHVFEER